MKRPASAITQGKERQLTSYDPPRVLRYLCEGLLVSITSEIAEAQQGGESHKSIKVMLMTISKNNV